MQIISNLSYLLAQRNTAIRNLLYELKIRIKEHDMEVFHSMNTLQRSPILEPDDLSRLSLAFNPFLDYFSSPPPPGPSLLHLNPSLTI